MSTCTAGGGCGKAAATRRILSGHHPWSSATATAAAAAAAVAAAAAAAAAVAVPVDPSGFARMAAPAGMPFAKCDDAKIIAGGADGLGAGGTGLALAACAAECLTNTACDHFVHYGDNGCKLYDGCTLIQTPAAWGVSSTVYKKMTTADPPTCACKYGVCPAGYEPNKGAVPQGWEEYGSRRRYPYPKGHYYPHDCPCKRVGWCPKDYHTDSDTGRCKPCTTTTNKDLCLGHNPFGVHFTPGGGGGGGGGLAVAGSDRVEGNAYSSGQCTCNVYLQNQPPCYCGCPAGSNTGTRRCPSYG